MRVGVIGAGPIGLEAAAAAEDAGHEVVVFEAGRVGAHVRRWSAVTTFTPWSMCTGPWGRRRLADPILGSDACPTGAQLVERYLEPLAATLDVRVEHQVIAVGRARLRKGQALGSPARADEPFRLLIAGPAGEITDQVDALLDCTGVLGDPAPVGAGGAPAPGEAACLARGLLRHGAFDVDDLAGRRVLLVGNGATAATALDRLLDLPETLVTWVTADAAVPGFVSPPDDPLPGRRRLVERARQAASRVDHRPGALVDRLAPYESGVEVRLTDGATCAVDMVLGCCGFRPDPGLLRELQVHLCWATEGPMKLAGALLAASGAGGDCLAQTSPGPDTLRSPEPRLFVLGSKSYGRRSDFLLQVGHAQVRDALGLLT